MPINPLKVIVKFIVAIFILVIAIIPITSMIFGVLTPTLRDAANQTNTINQTGPILLGIDTVVQTVLGIFLIGTALILVVIVITKRRDDPNAP
jgi:hypothetical protein